MKSNVVAMAVIGATAVLLAGCGDKASTGSPSSEASKTVAPTSAAAVDYAKLLIAAEDIATPGDTFTAQEPTVNPGGKPGVATVFSNAEDTHEIGDTIFVLPDAAAADTALQGAIAAFGSTVAGGVPETAEVGSKASMVSGTSPDGTKSITVLVFTEGTAFTTLEFDSRPDDPVPAEAVLDIAKKQDEKIKAGLGG